MHRVFPQTPVRVKSVLSSQFSVLSSQFSVLSSQVSVLSSQVSVLRSQFPVLNPCLSRPLPWRPGIFPNPVPPAEPPHSFLFPAKKNAAAPHECAASCCEWFQSAPEPVPTSCQVRSATDRNSPAAK